MSATVAGHVWSLVSCKTARSLSPVRRQPVTFISCPGRALAELRACLKCVQLLWTVWPPLSLLLLRLVCWRENKLVTPWLEDWLPPARAYAHPPASFVSRMFPPITWQPMKRKMWLMIFSFLADGIRHGPASVAVIAVINSALSTCTAHCCCEETKEVQQSHQSRLSPVISPTLRNLVFPLFT